MNDYSLARRAIALVLVTELICALAFSATSLWHEGRTRLRAFDVMLQGRSDSLLGAIQDAEDPDDNVTIDPTELQLPAEDVYAVYNQGGRLLGVSPNAPVALTARRGDGLRAVKAVGHQYRVRESEGLRIIDRAETDGRGLRRPVTIIYASPTDRMWSQIIGAAGFYICVSGVLICLTALILVFALRRLLSPLKELAIEAGKVDAHSTGFEPPRSALRVKELRPLSQALSGTIRKLQRALHMQHRFLSDAAHELKTAVAIERSTIQLLSLRPRSPDEYSKGLGRVLQDNERLEQLVSRMLTLGRFEEQPVTSSDSVDLGESAYRMVESIRHWVEAREITLVLDVEKNVEVALSEEAAETLISNLLINAVQHSASGSQVRLSIRVFSHAERKATLQVADCGKGIASESLPYVFERFYREDRSRSRETGGAGLGLAICKSIVEGAGGDIEVKSVLGRGTTATATLKLAYSETAC